MTISSVTLSHFAYWFEQIVHQNSHKWPQIWLIQILLIPRSFELGSWNFAGYLRYILITANQNFNAQLTSKLELHLAGTLCPPPAEPRILDPVRNRVKLFVNSLFYVYFWSHKGLQSCTIKICCCWIFMCNLLSFQKGMTHITSLGLCSHKLTTLYLTTNKGCFQKNKLLY